MTPEEIQAWIDSLPGKTPQQRFNYAQDLADAYNIDLFGANKQFVPETYSPSLDVVARTYGADPVYGPIFTAIDQGMSPVQAVQAAQQNPELKNYFPATGNGLYKNVLDVAGQYAAERLQNQYAEEQFNIEQANKQAIFEGKQPSGLPGQPASLYDVAGQPSLDMLMNMYMESLSPYKQSLGTTDLSVEPFRGSTKSVDAEPRQKTSGPWKLFGPNRGVNALARVFAPRRQGSPETTDEIRMRQEYAKSRTGAAKAEKKAASSSLMANDPAFKKRVEDRVREMAYRSIGGMSATPVMSNQDQQTAARWAALQRYSGAG